MTNSQPAADGNDFAIDDINIFDEGTEDPPSSGAPEIDVQRPAGTTIPDESIDPMGNQLVGCGKTLDYTILNTGTAQLDVTSANSFNPVNISSYTVVTALPLHIAPGSSATLTVTFCIDAPGPFNFDIDIISNDADEGEYDIDPEGTGVVPEIDVQRPAGTSIADGGTDYVGYQSVGAVNPVYTIDNTAGTGQLIVTGATASNFTNCSAFSVVTTMPLNVAAGATGTIKISFNVDAPGAFSFDMDIANNDANENPYDIQVTGNGKTSPTNIVLSSFYAQVGQDGILIKWTTETEPNNAGFNIFRSSTETGAYSKVNKSLIPALGNATTGASYSYIDNPENADTYYYKLQAISLTGDSSFHGPVSATITSVDLKKYAVPDNYRVSQNYPNPFNPETRIEYGLPKAGQVVINIYDINGHVVRNLISEHQSAGNHSVKWNARDNNGTKVVSGIYFYYFKAGDYSQTLKMILMK